MGSGLGCLLTFVFTLIFAIIVFVVQIASRFREILKQFGFGPQKNYNTGGNQNNTSSSRSQNDSEQQSHNAQGKKHEKVFTDDEGEYIDFKEIK